MGEPGRSVEEIISGKIADDDIPDQVANLIIGAMRGGEDLDRSPREEQPAPAEPGRAYLKAITVEGSRGIGPKITLTLRPGPGLTLVTGRNGSGKPSFAEAAGLALTGENKCWSNRTAVWREGWCNLHEPGTTAIAVELTEDGHPGITTVTMDWAAGAALGDASVSVQAAGGPRRAAAESVSKMARQELLADASDRR